MKVDVPLKIETKPNQICIDKNIVMGGALIVMVIVMGNGISDPSSNPGQGCLHSISCKWP